MKYTQDGKTWHLPDVLGIGTRSYSPARFFYTILGYRNPKQGEYYLSGAVPCLWRVHNDLDTPYLVAEIDCPAVSVTTTTWERDES
jgi:hypothetical protein